MPKYPAPQDEMSIHHGLLAHQAQTEFCKSVHGGVPLIDLWLALSLQNSLGVEDMHQD